MVGSRGKTDMAIGVNVESMAGFPFAQAFVQVFLRKSFGQAFCASMTEYDTEILDIISRSPTRGNVTVMTT